MNESLLLQDYQYRLPDERIALHPLAARDQSKLLCYREGHVNHHTFREIANLLPADALLFFNDTKVIPARLVFKKESGAHIEVFLLQPADPSLLVQQAMVATERSTWQCTIGNLKRWKEGTALRLQQGDTVLEARLADREKGWVEFSWKPAAQAFAAMVALFGKTPLPPYIKRKAETEDREWYQTVYAHHEGAVAAPTAGLHFTPAVLEALRTRGIETDFLTLHVGAGTFRPIKTENVLAHDMHEEQLVVSRQNICHLLQGKPVVAVGTTAMRVLESLYWYGTLLAADPQAAFHIRQRTPYAQPTEMSLTDSLRGVLKKMDELGVDQLSGSTAIFIRPGYRFRVCRGLITNFHQPGSSLILLVAAFVGNDWKRIYQAALDNDYRFLSYGDSSLLWPRLGAEPSLNNND